MSKYILHLIRISIIVFLIIPCAHGLGIDKTVSLSSSYLTGFSTYQIGGMVYEPSRGAYLLHFPVSELQFPLDAVLAKLQLNLTFNQKVELEIDLSKNVTTRSGKTKDSDWGIYSSPETLDIYSESDTTLDVWIGDIYLDYRILTKPSFALVLGMGYIYQYFDFEVANSLQSYPSMPDLENDYVRGDVLTYNIQYHIPHVRLGIDFRHKQFFAKMRVGYAPYVFARDKDRHLRRIYPSNPSYGYPVSTSDQDGTGVIVSLLSRYLFYQKWFIGGNVQYMYIKTQGKSSTSYSNGPYAYSIDQENETRQFQAQILMGLSF